MKLDKWQEDILKTKGNTLLCTGRQVGKTTIFSIKAAEYMINHPKSQVIVVSLTEDQAHLIIIMILSYLEKNYRTNIAKGKKKPTKNRISLKNGSYVLSRPVGNTGDAVRGFTGDVLIIDEASRMPKFMWAAATPTLLTTGGQIWMCSTPYGKEGYFYECFLNKSNNYNVFHISSEEVINNREISESWTERQKKGSLTFLKQQQEEMSKLEYSQEYLGMFIDDLQQLFPDDLIKRLMTQVRPGTIAKDREYYLGCDVARMGLDESTFQVLRRTPSNQLYHVENQVTKKTLLTETAKQIINLDRLYEFERIYIDSEGIGVGVFDMLMEEDSLKRRVEGLKNSTKVINWRENRKKHLLKQDLYLNLLQLMEKGNIHLLEDSNVFQSFKSVQFEFVQDKRGQTFMRIFGNYTHIVEGLIRAAWCVKSKNLNIWIDSISI